MTGGGPDTQGKRILPRHWPCGGDVGGSGGYFISTFHILHHLPQLPPWILVRLQHRYHYPRCQTASSVSGL